MVPIPEGQVIVRCPYCDLRSMVRGERGVQRYQVPLRLGRDQAIQALQRFLGSSMAIARDAGRQAQVEEVFIAHLPFWAEWARVLSWVFGEKRVGSGDNKRYEPREVSAIQEMSWNGAACDVGEFGVAAISLEGRTLEPFDPESLHASGLVFEPVGSISDAHQAAEKSFERKVHRAANLERISQIFVRAIGQHMGIVYYPLWILRYRYRGRTFQVVVDGFSGQILYGKAPGSVFYRAAVLVVGMAGGALIGVDGGALAGYLALRSGSDEGEFFGALALGALAVGFGLMFLAYRQFRYGEHYEFRQSGPAEGLSTIFNNLDQLGEMTRWLKPQ
jgi:hypothetical protein